MASFASIDDLAVLWRPLKPEETERAGKLLEVVSDSLRMEAHKIGKDLDVMVGESPPYFLGVVKSVTIDVVGRALETPTNGTPVTQGTESALGYSQSVSYLVPGGGLFIKNSELNRLGLRKQRIGGIEFYG